MRSNSPKSKGTIKVASRIKWLISKLVAPLPIRLVILLLIVSILIPMGAEASSVSPSSRQGLPKGFKVERLTYQESFPLYRPGEILVKFKTTTPTAERERVKALAGPVSTLREIGPKDRKDLHLIKLKPDVSVEEAIKKLKSQSEVLYAEPNYIVKALYTPNDPSFSNQWGLNNTGQTIKGVAGTPDADIDAPEAWDIEKGQTNPVTVAVVDSGIDFAHPELSSKIWQNFAEIGGNGVDDDANGYIDDVSGYNFAGISQTSVVGAWPFGYNTATQVFAQSIKGTGQKLTHVGILLSKSGSPAANITVSLRTSLGGSDLAYFTIYPYEVGTTETEIYKPLSSPLILNSGTTYYIVMQTADNSSINYYLLYDNWGDHPSSYDTYRDGQEHQWNGTSWVDWPSDDFYFRTNPNSYPRDDDGHGTHVSGIIGAASDNSQGITGLSFGAKIMPLKIRDSSGGGTISDEIAAIYYAADKGARVINMSLAGSVYSQSEQDAVNYAYGKGVVVVAAVGNDGDPTINYPAGDNNVIGVGATTNQDQKAYFSNYNSSVDVSAPGADIYSTLPTYPVGSNSEGYAQNYDYLSGTSMATPMVAGLAALVLSRNPSYTPLQVEQSMENNADDLGFTGWDSSFGYGRINAYRTLASIAITPGPLHHINITPSSATLQPGGTQVFSAQGYDQYSNPISDLTYTWTATGGYVYPTFGSSTTYTAGATPGNYQITATSGSVTGTASITIQSPPPPEPLPFTPPSPVFTSIYDYGNANTAFWIFNSYGTYLSPSQVWSSGPGNWEWARSKLTTGDFNGDGKSDAAIFYDYGSANTGLWLFSADSFSPVQVWSSGPGNWEWSRSKIVSADFYGDGYSDIAVFYDYGGSNTGLWVFNGTSAGFSSPSLKWSSGPGNWEWLRSKLTTGDFNNDGRSDIAVFYDYGNSNTGVWVFQSTGTGFNSPTQVWSSGVGNWDWSRTKIVPGDFDGDGKGDIGALYDYGGGNTSIWVFRGSNFPPIPFWSSGPGNWEWSRTRLPGEDVLPVPTVLPFTPPPPPAPSPPAPYQPGWHEVVTFLGNGDITTPIFGVLVSEWRITYTVWGGEWTFFGLIVSDSEGWYVGSSSTEIPGTYTTYFHEPGYFYIETFAANCSWKIVVEAYY